MALAWTVESAGAPAGGVFVLFLLNVLDQYVHDKHLADKPELYHYFIEVRLSNTRGNRQWCFPVSFLK